MPNPRLVLEEQDMEKITEEEEQTNLWGRRKFREREQEDKLTRSSLPKITGTVVGAKREQEEEKGARRKKARHKREPDNWGETGKQEQDKVEQSMQSQDSLNLSSPNWELPPLEQIVRPRRSKQASLREFLSREVGAPKGEPPEPAGRDTPMFSDISGGTEADQVSGGVADVMNDQEVMKCTFTKDGTCNDHGMKAEKLSIPTKKWAKKRGGGYGWKTVKISRFLCRAKKNLPVEPDIDRHVLPSASQDFRDFSGSQDSQFIGDLPVVIKE